MIITKLIGGLGNQMFQYAVGRRASYINKSLLKLDISGYRNQEGMTKREYLLNCFNIKENIASEKEISGFKKKNNLFQNILRKIYPVIDNKTYIKEKYFHFFPRMLNIRDNSYIEGYWVSEKYFKDIESIIRNEFTFKDKPDTINHKIIERIQRCNSISIHVRRGDYVSVKRTHECHGVCDLDYYKKAIKLISLRVKKPHFFIFSDDPQWAKQNLHLEFPCVYVDHNVGKKDYEDMRLMSECKHNIIANSSFSWWGAWLNQNKNKIIIAPRIWFNNKSINTKDLIPRSWMKI